MELTLEQAQDRIKYLETENETLKKLVSSANESQKADSDKLKAYEAFAPVDELSKISESLENLKAYEELGTAEDFEASLESLDRYRELASISDIHESIKVIGEMKDTIAKYEAFGTVDNISEAISKLSAFEELATPEQIEQAIETLENLNSELSEYVALGEANVISNSLNELNNYKEIGSLEQMTKAVDILESYVNLGSVDALESATKLEKLASKLGYTAESIEKTLQDKVIAEHKALIDGLCENYGITADAAEATYKLNNESLEATQEYLNMFKPYRAKSIKPDSLVGKVVESTKPAKVNESKTSTKRATLLNQF